MGKCPTDVEKCRWNKQIYFMTETLMPHPSANHDARWLFEMTFWKEHSKFKSVLQLTMSY